MQFEVVLIAVFLVVLGSLINGLAGFGFGIATTVFLSNLIGPRDAVTLMILPLLAINIPLIFQSDFKKVGRCIRSYDIFLIFSILSTLLGILLIGIAPNNVLSFLIGLISVLYVYSKQNLFYKPIHHKVINKCFTKKWYNQVLVGFSAGMSFGVTNIGLLFVTYISEFETDRKTFIGLLSLIIFVLASIRAIFSYQTELYGGSLLAISALLAVPAIIVTSLASKFREKVSETYVNSFVLILIAFAGLRLLFESLVI